MDQDELVQHLFKQQRIMTNLEVLVAQSCEPGRSLIRDLLIELRHTDHKILETALSKPRQITRPTPDPTKWY